MTWYFKDRLVSELYFVGLEKFLCSYNEPAFAVCRLDGGEATRLRGMGGELASAKLLLLIPLPREEKNSWYLMP